MQTTPADRAPWALAENVSRLRDARDLARQAERDAVNARFGREVVRRPEPYDFGEVRLQGDRRRDLAAARSAERNLTFAGAAAGAVDDVLNNLLAARDLVQNVAQAQADGTLDADGLAAAQAGLDDLLAGVDEAAALRVNGRRVFDGAAAPLVDVEAGDPDALAAALDDYLTDAEGYVDFDGATISRFSAGVQDKSGDDGATVDGREIALRGNAWKSVDLGQSHAITGQTYLEFEFRGTIEGERHGIALEDDDGFTADRVLVTWGDGDSFGHEVGDYDGGGAWQTYRVRVADHIAAGTDFDRLIFVNDDDRPIALGESAFRNVRVVEQDPPPPPAPASNGTGLDVTYYNGQGFGGPVLGTGVDGDVHHDWDEGKIGGHRKDEVSVRWEGRIEAIEAGDYEFRTRSDDGVRVWVNDELLIDNWTTHAAQYDYGSESVTLGVGERADVRIEYFEGSGEATMEFEWRRPGQGWSAVQAGQLYRKGTPDLPPPPVTVDPVQFRGDAPPPPGPGDEGFDPLSVASLDRRPDGPRGHFSAGPDARTGGYELRLGGLDTADLGGAAGRLLELKGGGRLDLSAALDAGTFDATLAALTESLAQARVQRGAIEGFAVASRAFGNVAGSSMAVRDGALGRLADAREATAQAEAARASMRRDGRLLAAAFSDYDRQLVLSALSG